MYDDMMMCMKEFITNVYGSFEGQFVVRLKYKYLHEDNYTFSNEVFSYDYAENTICWFNDWWEGQEECDFVYIFNLDALIHNYMAGADCIRNIERGLHEYRTQIHD